MRQVMEMSYEHNMIYNHSNGKEENIEAILERMLDHWYEITVCSLSPLAAQNKLLEILKESRCSPFVVHKVRNLCQTAEGGRKFLDENRESFRGSYKH